MSDRLVPISMARPARATELGRWRLGIAAALIAVLTLCPACTAAIVPTIQPVQTSATQPTLTRNLAGMHYVEPDGAFHGDGSSGMNDLPRVRGTGILKFDGACAYVHSLVLQQGQDAIHSLPTRDAQSVSANLVFQFGQDMDRAPDSLSQSVYLLKLGYNLVRYDPKSRALWVKQSGPMVEGDRVTFDGFYGRSSFLTFLCPLLASGRIGTATLTPAP